METAQTAVLDTFVNGQAFTISGDYDTIVAQKEIADAHLEALQATETRQTRNVAAMAVEATQTAPETATAAMVEYTSLTVNQKVRDWMSDMQWRRVDRELGLDGTELSIVRERQEQRLANRILVARQAAGVDKPPVWGKHKVALKLAEQALNQ